VNPSLGARAAGPSFRGNLRLWHLNHAPSEIPHLLKRRLLPSGLGALVSLGRLIRARPIGHRFVFRFGPRFNWWRRAASRHSRVEVCDGQLVPRQPLTQQRIYYAQERVAVARYPVVEPEGLFVQIAEHMKGVDGNVGYGQVIMAHPSSSTPFEELNGSDPERSRQLVERAEGYLLGPIGAHRVDRCEADA